MPGHDRDCVPHPLLLRRHPRPPDRDGPQEGLEGGARHVPLRPQRHLRLPRHLLLCYIDVIWNRFLLDNDPIWLMVMSS